MQGDGGRCVVGDDRDGTEHHLDRDHPDGHQCRNPHVTSPGAFSPGEDGEGQDQDGHDRRQIAVRLLHQRMEPADGTDLPGAQRPPWAAHSRFGHTDGAPENDEEVGRHRRCHGERLDPADTGIRSSGTPAPAGTPCARLVQMHGLTTCGSVRRTAPRTSER